MMRNSVQGKRRKMLKRIRRYVWTAMTALLIAASGYATASGTEPAFKEHCGECHARPSSVARSFSGREEQRKKAFDRFLSTHYAEDPQLRAEIVAYLLDLAR
jgi:hypothetical protein